MSDFNDPDFLADTPGKVVSQEVLDAELTEKVNALLELRMKIAEQETLLSELRKSENSLSGFVIPELFELKKVAMIKMLNGFKVEVVEELFASVPKLDLDARGQALKFLRENDGGDLIKEEIFLPEKDDKTILKLQELEIPYLVKQDVNSSSLKSWFKGKFGMKKGSLQTLHLAEVPPVFSLHFAKETKISR